jgi:(p)ppGpp synthase/HD superfamily hydrolase
MNLREIIREEIRKVFEGGSIGSSYYSNYPDFLDPQFNPQLGAYPPIGFTNYGDMMKEDEEEDVVIDPIERAREMAIMAHGNQTYGSHPYSYHLDQVVAVARELGYSDDVIIACYLHDTLEDTDLPREEIDKEFGPHIARVVHAVKDEDGANRKERKAKTYLKIAPIPDAIAVKLCDRIANVREALKGNEKLFKMYKKEHPGFEEALRNGSHEEAWSILDSLLA